MNKRILALRVLETVFLVVFAYSVSISERSTMTSWGLLSVNMGIRVGSVPSIIAFSTLSVGFGLSLLASFLMLGKVHLKYVLFSIAVGALGLLDLFSNVSASLGGNFLPFSLKLPIILCTADWVITWRVRKKLTEAHGLNSWILIFLTFCVVIVGIAPIWMVKKSDSSLSQSGAVFHETEVLAWVRQFEREEFDKISHSKLIENSGGKGAFEDMWSTLSALSPFSDMEITEEHVSPVYEHGTGILGGSCCDITTRSSKMSSEIYFRVYCRIEDAEWKISGFNVSDQLQTSGQ